MHEAKKQGYRSRAAFKLLQLDDKFHLLKPGARVVDLGAAPGGWTQVAVDRVGEKGHVVGIDLLAIDAIPGADLIQMDFMDEVPRQTNCSACLGGPADLVLSDMAASATGHSQTDHLRIVALADAAYEFAKERPEAEWGLCRQGAAGRGDRRIARSCLKRDFAQVKHVKPPASRSRFGRDLRRRPRLPRLIFLSISGCNSACIPAHIRPASGSPPNHLVTQGKSCV